MARRSGATVVVLGDTNQREAVVEALATGSPTLGRYHFQTASRLDIDELIASRTQRGPSCFVDVSDPRRASLYFADDQGERFLVRRLALPNGLDELGRESLAQVIEAGLDALREAGAATLNSGQLRELLKPTAKHEGPQLLPLVRDDQKPATSLGMAYGLRAFSNEVVTHGPVIDAQHELARRTVRLFVWVKGQFFWPKEMAGGDMKLELFSVTGSTGFGLRQGWGDRWGMAARCGAGIDFDHLDPSATAGSDLQATRKRWTYAAVATISLDIELALMRNVWFRTSAFADADFDPRHYDVERQPGRDAVIAPWRVRPGLALGLFWLR